jgi:hypothetical protein
MLKDLAGEMLGYALLTQPTELISFLENPLPKILVKIPIP